MVSCLTTIIAVQFFGFFGVGLALPVLLVATRRAWPRWWALMRRMRWLLLSVWLILAYGIAGDALFDMAWMPTREGAAAATLQTARLTLILGCLAWLFSVLDQRGLLAALASLLRPLSRCGLATERLVVRLSLVMGNLQVELPRGAWRSILLDQAAMGEGPAFLQVEISSWRPRDYLYCCGTLAISLLVVSLG